MKTCICGGGNLAHAFIGELGKNKNIEINVLTRCPNKWSRNIDVYYGNNFSHKSAINSITSDYNIIRDADIVIFTLPANVRFDYILKIKDFVNKNAILISAPSTGGINFLFNKYFPQNRYVCMQRVPYICRIIEYGHSVRTDVKKQISIFYSENCSENDKLLIKSIIKMDISELKSIYPLILSNSNPILHIAGMIELIKNNYPCKDVLPFYEKWSDYASELCVKMDEELSEVMEKLKVEEHKTLYEHYEVKSISELTKKLKSIPSFKQVMSPVIFDGKGGYILDKNSRYLAEDLPFGTCFIKLYAQKFNIKTPTIDFCIKKLQPILDTELINDNDSLNLDNLELYVKYIKEIMCNENISGILR